MATSGINMFFNSLNRKLEPHIKDHLKDVYSTMAMALLSAAIGGYIHLYTTLLSGGIMSTLGTLGFGIALFATKDNAKNRTTRLGYLMGLALCSGLSMGPLLSFAIMVNPSLVPTALLSTCAVFGCFTLSTFFADHRKMLYMGGTLMSLLSVLIVMSLVNLFIGSQLLFSAYLYLGLVVVCGFIMYDTALIIEKRRMGDTDYIHHALLLFIDFIDLFRHILIILTKKEAEKDRKRRN
jgi:FtsH-binding integral membrane protein